MRGREREREKERKKNNERKRVRKSRKGSFPSSLNKQSILKNQLVVPESKKHLNLLHPKIEKNTFQGTKILARIYQRLVLKYQSMESMYQEYLLHSFRTDSKYFDNFFLTQIIILHNECPIGESIQATFTFNIVNTRE